MTWQSAVDADHCSDSDEFRSRHNQLFLDRSGKIFGGGRGIGEVASERQHPPST
jgi:hypothetical protein